MMRLSSSHTALLAGVLFSGTALVLALTGDERGYETRDGRQAGMEVAAPRSAKSDGTHAVIPATKSKMAGEIRGVSIRGVRDQLPVALSDPLRGNGTDGERTRLLFRRLGELEGEQALDEIVSRYANDPFVVDAMIEAIIGWMEADRSAAYAALVALLGKNGGMPLNPGITWKGTRLTSGFG